MAMMFVTSVKRRYSDWNRPQKGAQLCTEFELRSEKPAAPTGDREKANNLTMILGHKSRTIEINNVNPDIALKSGKHLSGIR
jgi:hypothetical protein